MPMQTHPKPLPNPPHQSPRPTWALALLALAFTTLAGPPTQARAQGDPPGPPPALVRVGQIHLETLQSRWDVVGRLVEVRRASVAAEQQGRIVEVPVEEGHQVQAGQTVLARIDDIWVRLALTEAKARRQQALAAVAEMQALLELARRDRTYLAELFASGSAKPKERDDAVTNEKMVAARLERANADLAAVEAELDRRKEEQARLTVVAPFDGSVLKKLVEVGQWVQQGDPVAEILSRGQIDAVVDVPERLISNLALGTSIDVNIEATSEEIPGQIVSIVPAAATAARTFPVKIRLDDQAGKLRPGMTVNAKIPTGQRQEMLTVPRDALARWGNGMAVWIIANGIALPAPVKILFGHGDRYAVQPLPGAGAGAEGPPLTQQTPVVIEGAERLFPGRPVALPDTDPTAAHQ